MEPDMQHRPNNRITNFSLVDIPLATDSNTASVRKICTLLNEGSKIVCVTKRTMGGDDSILAELRDSLPGFVALLDHQESSDIPISLAKSLSLGSDDTDEKILQSRWQNFSQTIQHSTLPFTLIVPNADTLSKSRLTQINEFLRPLKGRLILAGCDDIAKLFDVTEAVPDSPSPDNNVISFSDRGIEAESAAPILIDDVVAEPPTITDEVLPDVKPAPVADAPHTRRRSNRNKKPIGWLSVGLGLGGILGFLVANLTTSYGPIDFNQGIKGIADEWFVKNEDKPALSNETLTERTSENRSVGTDSEVLPRENSNAIVTLPMGATDDPHEKRPVSPTDTAVVDGSTTTASDKPATDLAALEKSPVTDKAPVIEKQGISESTPPVTDAAAQPMAPPDTDTNKLQPERAEVIDPAERARLAAAYINRAEIQWDMNNLQQALLEVARGLDVDPDNQRLHELRQHVLIELNARSAQ